MYNDLTTVPIYSITCNLRYTSVITNHMPVGPEVPGYPKHFTNWKKSDSKQYCLSIQFTEVCLPQFSVPSQSFVYGTMTRKGALASRLLHSCLLRVFSQLTLLAVWLSCQPLNGTISFLQTAS
jgi:hypothetical protein